MPLINRIEVSNFMNSTRAEPWRPDWALQRFDLMGENTAINMPNGKGKSTLILTLLAMLTPRTRSLSDIRGNHFAPLSTGRYTHVRMETYIWADDGTPNDLIAQAGGDFGGYPMVFGIYGNAGETGRYKLYAYRGMLEDCPVGYRVENRVTLVDNQDFLEGLDARLGRFPANQREESTNAWREFVGTLFDMASLEQQLVYQLAKGAEGSGNYFDVSVPHGRTYAEAVFYERLAPELLADVMGSQAEEGERDLGDTIHVTVQGILRAKVRTENTRSALERTRHLLEEFDRLKERALRAQEARAVYDEKLSEAASEFAALHQAVVAHPIPGLPTAHSSELPEIARALIVQRGEWYLPDGSFELFTGEAPSAINQRADRHRIETESTERGQRIEITCDLKTRDDRGKPSRLYRREAAQALIGATTKFQNGYTRVSALEAVDVAFDWAQINGDTNPARIADREQKALIDDLDNAREEAAERHETLKTEREKLISEQQTIGQRQTAYREMAESMRFTPEELAVPAATGKAALEGATHCEKVLTSHRIKVASNQEVATTWHQFIAEHGDTADPVSIAKMLQGAETKAQKNLIDNKRAIEEAKRQTPALNTAVDTATKAYATRKQVSDRLTALAESRVVFNRLFAGEDLAGLENRVLQDLSRVEGRLNDIKVRRAPMWEALAALGDFHALSVVNTDPVQWLRKRRKDLEDATGSAKSLQDIREDLQARRDDLDRATVAPGRIAREVLVAAGGNAEPLHAVIERLTLPQERKTRVLSLFSAILFAPVYGSAEEATIAANGLVDKGLEAPVFLAGELEAFCRDADIFYDGATARTWLVGVRTRPVDCLLDPDLVPREKAELDANIQALNVQLGDIATECTRLDPEHPDAILARKAAEAIAKDYVRIDADLIVETGELEKELPRVQVRAAPPAVEAIRAEFEAQTLLGDWSEQEIEVAMVAANEALTLAKESLNAHLEQIEALGAERETLQTAYRNAQTAAQSVIALQRVAKFIDDGGPAFMSTAAAKERELQTEKERADARTKYRFDLADAFVRSSDKRPQEIEDRLKSIKPELRDIEDRLLPDLDERWKQIAKIRSALAGKIFEIDALAASLQRKYHDIAAAGEAMGTDETLIGAHPLLVAAGQFRALVEQSNAKEFSETNSPVGVLQEIVDGIEAAAFRAAIKMTEQQWRSADKEFNGEIDRVLSNRDAGLNEQMRVSLELARNDVASLVTMAATTRENYLQSDAANKVAQEVLDQEWQGVSEWLENFTRRLPGNFQAMRAAFRPERDSVTGAVIQAGFEIEARLVSTTDIRAVLDGIVERVEKEELIRANLSDDDSLRATAVADMRRQIRNEFYRNILREPKIRLCIPSISRKPLPLERNIVSSGQGIAMTLLWIVKMADYVTERELRRSTVSAAVRTRLRSNRTQFVIIDGAFSHLSDKKLIDDALGGVKRTRGRFQLIITGHDPNYRNDYHYFPTYICAREIGGNMMYAESGTRRLLAPAEVGSHEGAMEIMTMRKLADQQA